MKAKQDMSALGRKGGAATKAKYGAEHYKKTGQAGGRATKEVHGPEHFAEIGRKGGQAMATRAGHAEAAGRLGGRTTAARYGDGHFHEIGRKGASAAAAKRRKADELRAALEPFHGWLEARREELRRMQLQDAGAAESTCLGAGYHYAVSYGDCARLLAAMDGLTPTIVDPSLTRPEAQRLADTVAQELGQRVVVVGRPEAKLDTLLAQNAQAAEGGR